MRNRPTKSRTRDVYRVDFECAERTARVLALLKGAWTLHVLCATKGRPVRLSELKRMMPFASKKALTASLRSLEAMQVIVRRDLSSVSLHVEYEIAESMRDAIDALLDFLSGWASFLPHVESPGTTINKAQSFKSRSP
ncbi:helix-turn-helix transcriptional regulator [Acidobacteria bacterium AB60]|nr:helix-turn-helix transcriptional regulator [Acidobacteria bacterium AB60]